ncbi:peptidylprolyl isomerase [Flavobacterium ardleyense]|uniref:Periplasmic chaperone PpiD n=1 Tax=Flavobacterium ardleyense TaxID=2038737 RepID=A0ABW5Z711_9FLAO
MAVLSKIRQRTGLLIVVIGFCLLAFLVGDAFQSGTFGSDSNDIGSVNGTDIQTQNFLQKVSNSEKQGQGISNTQAINNTWEQEVRSIILSEEFDKLGLKIGDEQFINIVKQNPQLAQNPQFMNAAGQFDENKFKESLKSLKNAQNQEQWMQWTAFENNLETYTLEQMYSTMIKAGVYTTKAEGKMAYKLEADKADFEYVMVPFSSINDDQVKVTDAEIIDFMKKSPKKYKSEKTTSIDFVVLANKASKEDETAISTKINEIRTQFDSVSNRNIGKFVNDNSEIKFDSTYIAKKDLPIEFQEELFNLSSGAVFGPYVFSDYQCVSKMIGKKANASAKASHILIAYAGAPQSDATRTKEEAKTLANSLLVQAKSNPEGFAMLAMANSDDPGSKGNGGEYDNIAPGQMVPTFNDFVFNNGVGSIGLVETDFGFHVIKVTGKYDAVLLGTVAQKIQPSDATVDATYSKASQFEANALENKDFAALAKKDGLEVVNVPSLKAIDENVQGLGSQREIVRWAFNSDTKVNSIRRFETPQGFVIAKMKSKNDTGLLSIEEARQYVEPILKNKKKAELIKKKMSGTTLDAVSKASGASIIPALGITLKTPVIPNVGNEPKIVGKAFNLTAGKASEVLEGNTGMYVIQGKSVTKATDLPSYATYVGQETAQNQGYSISKAYSALKEKAKIKDNRGNF